MMIIFYTPTGGRYHTRQDLDCGKKASRWFEEDLDYASKSLGLSPCVVCGAPQASGISEIDARWMRSIKDWNDKGFFETLWERAFAVEVLAKVSNLSSDDVQPQKSLPAGASQPKVDFYIEKARLVLEVDGYNKDSRNSTGPDEERRNRRDAALVAGGYRVLHFTNVQVRQEPKESAKQIEIALVTAQKEREAQAAAHIDSHLPRPETQPLLQPEKTGRSLKPWLIAGVGVVAASLISILVLANVDRGSSNGSGTSQVTTTESLEADSSGSSSGAEASGGGGVTKTWESPEGSNCIPGYLFKVNIKGNDYPDGDDFVHSPEGKYYDSTTPERCYATRNEAYEDGFVEYFGNCTSARGAGVTPILRDENPTLYAANKHLDADEDGVACE